MRISPETRDAAKEATGNPELMVWYVPPNERVVIGYAIMPDATKTEMPATTVQVTLLDPSVAHTCTLVRSSVKRKDLFWITITQGRGTVWYRWTAPDGTVHDFLAYGDDEDDTANSRRGTARRARRLQIVWKLMHQTGKPFEVAKRVCDAANNNFRYALCAIKLAEKLLVANSDDQHKTREVIETFQTGSLTDRLLLRELKEVGANDPKPVAVRAILRGAWHVLDSHRP